MVWARKTVSSEECPRSYITAQSVAWVEEFLVRRRLGTAEPVGGLSARDAEAFLVLAGEWEGETAAR